MIATAALSGLGTRISVSVTEPAALPNALREVTRYADHVDLTVNRDRASAEIHAIDLAGGSPAMVGVLLEQILTEALYFADVTDGATRSVRRSAVPDYRFLPHLQFTVDGPRPMTVQTMTPVPEWHRPRLGEGRVVVPTDVRLELLGTARAFLADRAAQRVATRFECGAMVTVGDANTGSVTATAGHPPLGGWHVPVGNDFVELEPGHALATVTRTDIDALPRSPFDPRPAPEFDTVTTIADEAGSAYAAALMTYAHPDRAPHWLIGVGVAARTVDTAGRVHEIGHWPSQPHAHAA